MIYAVIDPAKRSIVFANAGHLPPLFVDSTGPRFLEIDSGLPLGIQEVAFTEYRLDMPAGSRLLLYSDGVSEAMNSSLEEYGATRLRDQMANPSASVQSLLDEVRTFAGGYPASDDRTLVMIRTHD
jgi:sigma-B regulation protein RsbU (phosphoserine phosphatase)